MLLLLADSQHRRAKAFLDDETRGGVTGLDLRSPRTSIHGTSRVRQIRRRPMGIAVRPENLLYAVDDQPPPIRLILLGVQYAV